MTGNRQAWLVTGLACAVMLVLSYTVLGPDKELTVAGSIVTLVTVGAALTAAWIAWARRYDEDV